VGGDFNNDKNMKKKPDYRVYIDEAGDEGFKFLPNESGSSRWFVLSATIVRVHNDHLLVQAAKETRRLLQKPEKHPLHFRHLKHEQRIPFSRVISTLPVRTVNILIHKPTIPDPEHFQRKPYELYRYCCRLLMERVSWLCRDGRTPEQDSYTAELVFSNRSAMSYEDLTGYLEKLMAVGGNGYNGIQIDWGAIDLGMVRAVNHDQMAGLQIADAVASGAFYAVHRSIYGETEERYLNLMRRTLYRHRGRVNGYGMKFWCADEEEMKRVLAACANQDPR